MRGAALLLSGVMIAELALSVRQQSQTWNEAYHLLAGYRYLQAQDYGINSEHPPLVKLLAALPLIPHQLNVPHVPQGTSKREGYMAARKFLYSNDADALLLRARLAAGILALTLALLVFEAARRMFGVGAAFLAMGLVVFEPNLLGHGALVTTDVGMSCCLFASVYAFYRYLNQPSTLKLVECGCVAGLTLAAKHSGVLVFPILGLLELTEVVFAFRSEAGPSGQSGKRLRAALRLGVRLIGRLAIIALIALAVLWAFYGFRFAARPAGAKMTPPLAEYISGADAPGIQDPVLSRLILGLHRARLLPESYLYGFSDVLMVSEGHRAAFLFGKLYPKGQWFYFPAVFIIKSTLGFLLLLLLVPFARRFLRAEKPREVAFMLLPVGLYFAISLTSKLNVGIRHLLPVYPFLAVLVAGATWHLAKQHRRWAYTVTLLVGVHMFSSLRSFPDYLAYSNEIWGGPDGTYRVLTDSNADGGQGLIAAQRYLEKENIRDCWLGYFGSADPSYYNLPCKLLPDRFSSWWGDPVDATPASVQGTLLIGATQPAGVYWGPGDMNPYEQFMELRPAKVLAGSILVFRGRFDLPAASAWSRLDRIWGLDLTSQLDKAITEANTAVKLAPRMVYAHYTLGYLLAMGNQKTVALDEYETALHLARTDHPEYQWYWVPFLEKLISGLQ